MSTTYVGVLTRQPFRHPGVGGQPSKVAYCTMSTIGEDLELVVFRKNTHAYKALLSLDEGDVVEVRGTKHLDTYKGNTTKELIVTEIAKDRLEEEEEPELNWEDIDAI